MANGGMNRHSNDWEQQRERLSAYLDGELPSEERAALERHLPGCSECRRELEDYRTLRAMLRAVPAPALPRSFTLPATGAVPEPLPAQRSRPDSVRPRTRAGSSGVARAAQALGGLVAVAGLLLFLGATLISGPRPYAATTAGNYSSSYQPAIGTKSTDTAQSTHTGGPVGPGVATARPNEQHTPTGVAASPTIGTSTSKEPATGEAAPPLPIIGGGMLLGGAALFVAGTVARKRRG